MTDSTNYMLDLLGLSKNEIQSNQSDKSCSKDLTIDAPKPTMANMLEYCLNNKPDNPEPK